MTYLVKLVKQMIIQNQMKISSSFFIHVPYYSIEDDLSGVKSA